MRSSWRPLAFTWDKAFSRDKKRSGTSFLPHFLHNFFGGGRGGGGELVGCTQSRVYGAHAPRLPRFMLLISFSDTLLVVSILDINFRKSMIAI